MDGTSGENGAKVFLGWASLLVLLFVGQHGRVAAAAAGTAADTEEIRHLLVDWLPL